MEAASVVDLVDEPRKVLGEIGEGFVGHRIDGSTLRVFMMATAEVPAIGRLGQAQFVELGSIQTVIPGSTDRTSWSGSARRRKLLRS